MRAVVRFTSGCFKATPDSPRASGPLENRLDLDKRGCDAQRPNPELKSSLISTCAHIFRWSLNVSSDPELKTTAGFSRLDTRWFLGSEATLLRLINALNPDG